MKQLKRQIKVMIYLCIKQADTGEDKYLIKFDLERIGGWGTS